MKKIAFILLLLAAIWQMSCYHIMDGLVPAFLPEATITIDGGFTDWAGVPVFFEDENFRVKVATDSSRNELYVYAILKQGGMAMSHHLFISNSIEQCYYSGQFNNINLFNCQSKSAPITGIYQSGTEEAEMHISVSSLEIIGAEKKGVIYVTHSNGQPVTEPRYFRIREEF